MFSEAFRSELGLFDEYLKDVLADYAACPLPELERFWESMGYSLYSEGKRFRPLLTLLTAKALNRNPKDVLPLAAAVELIHTYSLIHDDLPVMDNDDLRRGRPTNHKVYGDAQALLAGDALLTLAFGVLARSQSPRVGAAVQLLAQAAGAQGMVGGQVLDIEAKEFSKDQKGHERLMQIHSRKTGALIAVSVEASAVLLEADDSEVMRLREYGQSLGLAFQLADDLQDFNPDKPEKVNYVNVLGLDKTKHLLAETSEKALAMIAHHGDRSKGLLQMIQFNLQRI